MKFLNKMNPQVKELIAFLFWMVGGNFVFAIAFNMIITPVNLYNGGFMGMSQLLSILCNNVLPFSIPSGFNLVGVIYFIINVPLFIWAYVAIGRSYALKTLLAVGVSSLSLIIVPVIHTPIVEETITACLIGGVVAGTGSGMVLRSGCAGGGQDIVGVIMSKRHPNVSVGYISIIINMFVFSICFLLFDIGTVIYSLIYTTILAMFMDRAFVQNINVQVLIFTKNPHVVDIIIKEIARGVTIWKGEGGFTKDETNILCTIVSKYEVEKLKMLIRDLDPDAFIIINEGSQVYGGFEKRLTR